MPFSDALTTHARAFISTPFVHGGRILPGADTPGGLDCIGLVVIACKAAGACDRYGTPLHIDVPAHYPRIPEGRRLQDAIEQRLSPLPPAAVRPGDIALFRIRRLPQHVGIIGCGTGGEHTLIHAYQGAGKTAEHPLDAHWRKRMIAVYRPDMSGNGAI